MPTNVNVPKAYGMKALISNHPSLLKHRNDIAQKYHDFRSHSNGVFMDPKAICKLDINLRELIYSLHSYVDAIKLKHQLMVPPGESGSSGHSTKSKAFLLYPKS